MHTGLGLHLRHQPTLLGVEPLNSSDLASQVLEATVTDTSKADRIPAADFHHELESGLQKAGIPVHHFLLHADHDTLVQRIETDTVETGARQWRLDHLADYQQAQPWLSRRAQLIDTNTRTPTEVAALISDSVKRTADGDR